MRKVKEILRMRYIAALSYRQISAATATPIGSVSNYCQRFEILPHTIEAVLDMDESDIESLLFPERKKVVKGQQRPLPNLEYIHRQIHKKGVTFLLLWQEYKEANPQGYGYTQFKDHYHRFNQKLSPSMRQIHLAGEKLFVDYSGMTVPIVDARTGERSLAQIFVATLGASGYTFVHATASQRREDFIASHVAAFEFFGGVPQMVVPDNLKAAVTSHSRKGVVLNESYADMARHYGCAIVPARPKKPQDKGKVEQGVQGIQRWILAALRHHTFFDVSELNDAISRLLDRYNNKVVRHLGRSRTQLFEELDRLALAALPKERYHYRSFLIRSVPLDYHVEVEKCFYSVPFGLLKKRVEVWYSSSSVEIFYGGRCVAVHPRLIRKADASTLMEHMPLNHQYQQEKWNPDRILRWAGSIGPDTRRLMQAIMKERDHPVRGYRTALAILNLSKTHTHQALEQAATWALKTNTRSVRGVTSILEHRLYSDRAPSNTFLNHHENIRGAHYYTAATTTAQKRENHHEY